MIKRIRLGVLVPSSNTALEPLTQMIISSIDDSDSEITVHFSRFRVTQIDLTAEANSQFNLEHILTAADLLADAEVHVIGWSGTSAGWLGFETDEKLCSAIEKRTKIRATTSTLSLNLLLQNFKIDKLALLTPYTTEMNNAVQANYAGIGVNAIPPKQALNITKNTKMAEVDERTLDQMVTAATTDLPDAVVIFCTNLRAAQRVAYWEKLHKVLVFDTVSTVIWDMLRISGVNPSVVQGFGRMFDSI